MSDEELLKIRNFGDKSLVELKEKLVEHGMTDIESSSPVAVGEISPEELGELMGGEELAAGAPGEAPGMSIENMDQEATDDDLDDSQDEGED